MSEIHDFDSERRKRHEERAREFGEKPFRFGGEVFYVRPNAGYQAIRRVAALSEDSGGEATFSAIEDAVFSMIDPRDGSAERLRSVLNNIDDPITFEDLVALQNWLIEEQTGRPPTQEQSSASGPEATGTHLTAVSSTGQVGA